MINDWTFDMFAEDAEAYKATPIKGVHCPASADYREYFMTWLKNEVRDFRAKWKEAYGTEYSATAGYIGDAFSRECLNDGYFSDFYKDAYGQRPHLPNWFYVHTLGLPTDEDVLRLFCADPIGNAKNNARICRGYAEF